MIIGIFGPSTCGKDEAAEFLAREFGLIYHGTTSVVISRQIAKEEGRTLAQTHTRRHARKLEWRAKGDQMREHDPAALAREILGTDGNLLVGVRASIEMETVIKERLTDYNLWIDRPSVNFDPTMGFGPDICDAIIPNWWGIREYHIRLWAFARLIGLKAKHDGPTLLETARHQQLF